VSGGDTFQQAPIRIAKVVVNEQPKQCRAAGSGEISPASNDKLTTLLSEEPKDLEEEMERSVRW
jgi:hypothetical protein